MLETLRDASKGWVATILIGLLILSFAVWGVNDMFSGGTSTTLAKVGDAKLDALDFENEFTMRTRRMVGADGNPLTAAEAREQGFDRVLLNEMIEDIALDEEARKLGVTATDAMVATAIRDEIPGMTGLDGQLDRNAFNRALQSIGMSEAQFVATVRADLTRRQLLQTAAIGAPAPRALTTALLAYANERRAVEYIVLPPEKAAAVTPPDDATLQAYIEANAAAYTAPELRAITVLSVGPQDIAPTIEIPEADLKAAYDANSRRFETLETRELQQIIYPDQAAAEAAAKEIADGKSFEDLAAAQNLKPEDLSLGVIEKGDPAVPAGAFDVAEGGVTPALQGPFGWVLIKVVKVTPGVVRTFDEVKDELRSELANEQAIDKVFAFNDQIEDARAGGQTLEEIAKTLNLKVTKIPAMDAEGRDAAGQPIDGLPDGPGFLADAFLIEPGEEGDIADTPSRTLYVIRVDSATPAALRPLADVRDAAVAAWTAQQQVASLKTVADEAAARAKAGNVAMVDLATELGLEAKTADGLARDTANEDLSPALITALFETPAETWVAGAGTTAPRMVIARVKAVTHEAPADATAAERELRQAETSAMSGDMANAYAKAILAATKVEIDEALFEQIRRRGQ